VPCGPYLILSSASRSLIEASHCTKERKSCSSKGLGHSTGSSVVQWLFVFVACNVVLWYTAQTPPSEVFQAGLVQRIEALLCVDTAFGQSCPDAMSAVTS
jgi:hypothetical protein